ncbi:hypothetical protein NR800_32675 [Corallococcus interemptor]|uniref:hypothetical protein n=1 Tax=Corallococcus TaxID=83461 RepID=UPI001CC02EEF|nr:MULTISPECIES: hypothetical protein [unclassified Corallococcus]MBZ4332147.1 hypothetical protein [Corallococcus sp. AS-1-12]MBZ4372918.1 hypothetical protein [Corallococcus sp. AS-1-6]
MKSYPYSEGIKELRAGNFENAQRLVEQAKQQGDASVEELQAMAFAMDAHQQRGFATELLQEALKREPSAVEPACALAMFHLEKQEDAQAAAVLKPALDAAPDHPKANLCMAMALAKTEAAKARAHLTKAAKDTDADVRAQAEALDKVLAEHEPR